MVGILTVAIVPLAFWDRIDRYVLLPELAFAYIGMGFGYVGWFLYGGRPLSLPLIRLAAGFLCVEVGSIFFGQSPGLSLVPVMTDFVYVSLLVLVAVGLTRNQIEKTAEVSAFVCGIVSLIGILQYLDIGTAPDPDSWSTNVVRWDIGILLPHTLWGSFPLPS